MAHVKPNGLMKLVDELGEVVEQRKHYATREDALKELIKKHGPGAYRGRIFDALLSPRTMSSYKTELLKQYVDEDTLEKCKVTSPYLKVDLTRRVLLQVAK